MRGLRERPRIAVAQALVVCCLIAVGVAIGAAVSDDGDAVSTATQTRLDRAERAIRQERAKVRTIRAATASLTEQLARIRRRLADERRARARLLRELRRAQQARRRLARRERSRR